MGLAINYKLWAPESLPVRTLRGWLEQTRAFALKLGCKEVGPVEKVGPDFIWGRRSLTGPGPWGPETPLCEVKPRRGYVVEIWPGDGCESAHFGLCQYPRQVRIYGDLYRPAFAIGWTFRSSCKTQYAHEHGWEHFLRCHQTIISLLEFMQGLGIGMAVDDEGQYWQTRSEAKLRAMINCYDGFMAAVAGMVKDVADETGTGLAVEAPIFARKDFEKLEAEGCQKLGRQLSEQPHLR